MGDFQFGGIVERVTTTATSASLVTLTNTSRQIQVFTGSTAQTVQLPDATTMAVGQKFEFYNGSTATITLHYNDTTTLATVPAGNALVIKAYSIGTTNGSWATDVITNLDASVITSGVFSIARTTVSTQAISGTAIDWSTGSIFTKTLSANITFTFSNQISGQTIVVRLTNTASNYTVTWPSVKWTAGTAPTMTTGATSDVYTFVYDGTNTYGSVVQDLH